MKRILLCLFIIIINNLVLFSQQTVVDINVTAVSPKFEPNSTYIFGEEIKFTGQLSQKPVNDSVSYQWRFGDGSISFQLTSIHFYSRPTNACSNTYDVEFITSSYRRDNDTLSYEYYHSDTLKKSIIVYFRPEPRINPDNYPDESFSEEEYYFRNCRAGELNPDSVNYTIALNNLTSGSCIKPNSYSIDWGDGSKVENIDYISVSNEEHTYKSFGSFTLKLRVISSQGIIGENEYPVINDANPLMGLPNPGSTVGCAPLFFESSINDYEKNSRSTKYYFWIDAKTNDPIVLSQQEVVNIDGKFSYLFNTTSCGIGTDNSHIIYFEANNGCLPTKGSIEGIYVSTSPIAQIGVDPEGCPDQPITFRNNSISGSSLEYDCEEGKGERYDWDFGDGEKKNNVQKGDIIHTYTTPGEYTVILKAYANRGCTDPSWDTTIVKINPDPIADFSFTKDGDCLSTITFQNESQFADRFNWVITPTSGFAYLDNTSSSSENPKIKFTKAGEYTLQLLASNNCKSNVPSEKQTILVVDKPTIYSIPKQEVCKDAILATSELANGIDLYIDNNSPITAYKWEITTASGSSKTVSNEALPEISFDTEGVFTIKVTASNSCGVATEEFTVTVIGDIIPKATLNGQEVDNILINPGSSVTFIDKSDGSTNWFWTVSPTTGVSPQQSSIPQATFTFNEAQDYTITQTVGNGCLTAEKTYTVKVAGNFSATIQNLPTLCDQGTITFDQNLVTYQLNNSDVDIEWKVEPIANVSMSDINTKYPSIEFQVEGEYDVWVEVKDKHSDKVVASEKKKVYVYGDVVADALADNMNAGKLTGKVNESIEFKDNSSGRSIGYNWNSTNEMDVIITTPQSKDATFRFTKPGNYLITQRVWNPCDTSSNTYNITITDAIQIDLKVISDQCIGNILDMSDFVNYDWRNNDVEVSWTSNRSSEEVVFSDPNVIQPSVTLNGFGFVSLSLSITNKTENKTITPEPVSFYVNENPSAKVVPTKWGGIAPLKIVLSQESTGGQLAHNYSVSGGSYEISDDPSSITNDTSIVLNDPGIYVITYSATNNCGDDQQLLQINVSGKPSISFPFRSDVCGNFIFNARNSDLFDFTYDSDSLISINWDVTQSDGLSDGYRFINQTLKSDTFPEITFDKVGVSYLLTATIVTGYVPEGISNSKSFFLMSPPTIDIDSSDTLICLSNTNRVQFQNNSGGVSDSLQVQWEVNDGNPDGWGYATGFSSTSNNNELVFTQPGNYKVNAGISNRCGTDTTSFNIRVRDITVISENIPQEICLNSDSTILLNMADFFQFDWRNNPKVVEWNFSSETSVIEFVNGTISESPQPELRFYKPGKVDLAVTASSVCGETVKNISFHLLADSMKALFENADTAGCLPKVITFKRKSVGDGLTYEWKILRNGQASNKTEFTLLSEPTDNDLRVEFKKWGNYEVQLIEQNLCKRDTFRQNLRLFESPTILALVQPEPQCGASSFNASESFDYIENGSPTSVSWNITRNGKYWKSIDEIYPVFTFPYSGDYSLQVSLQNECGELIQTAISLKVDSAYVLKIGEDVQTCWNAPLVALTDSNYKWGSWRCIEDPSRIEPEISEDSTWLFKTDIIGIYTVEYTLENGSCTQYATKTIEVRGLPELFVRDTFTCVNNYDDVHLEYFPKGGVWSGEGVSPEGIFNVLSLEDTLAGDYTLIYKYEDSVTECGNSDTIIVSVKPKPEPHITLPNSKACILKPFLFIAENINDISNITWDYGDGNSEMLDPLSEVFHTYQDSGIYTVKAFYQSNFGCLESTEITIEVLGPPPTPVFEFDPEFGDPGFPNMGCGPFNPRFILEELPYLTYELFQDSLSYVWDFGNGRIHNGLIPPDDVYYEQGFEDTTYFVSFTVRNYCFSETYIDSVIVKPKPIAKFEMMHEWFCSPVQVEFVNLTRGLPQRFYWDFGDGFTSTQETPIHEFIVDSVTTVFNVRLIAENSCGVDTFEQQITIKPQTIRAFFELDKKIVCVGEPIHFTNYSSDKSTKIVYTEWDFGDGNRDTSNLETTHVYQEPGKYYVTLFINNYCGFDRIVDSILVEPRPTVEIISADEVCENQPIQFSTVTDYSIGAYRWSFDVSDTSINSKPEYTFSGAGKHVVKAELMYRDGLARCSGVQTKEIQVFPVPKDTITPEIVDGCSPFSYQPVIHGTGDYYLWNFGEDSLFIANSTYSYRNNTAELKRNKVTVISENKFGCKDTIYSYVTTRPEPESIIEKELLEEYPEKVMYYNFTERASKCVWVFENGDSVFTCDDQIRYYSENGSYLVKLISWNQYNCSSADSILHITSKNRLYFPNTFIPSLPNDDVNVFRGVGMGLKKYRLEVYDRWNNKIWETEKIADGKPAEGWDGTDKSGKALPQDVYYWRCWASFSDETIWEGMPNGNNGEMNTQGTITLIR